VIASLSAFLVVGVASAEAFHYRMSYGQAKNASKEFVRGLCDEDRECVGWGVGQCRRMSESRFDCLIGTFFPGNEPGEETECDVVLHWGAERGGYIALKNYGRPRCYSI
jgi:hypothetical protein